MIRSIVLIAPVLLLAGCGETEQVDEVPSVDAPGQADAVPPAPPAGAGQTEAVGNVRYRSAYGEFGLELCTQLSEQVEEGTGGTWRCPGRDGTALFVQSGDGRFDLDAGVDNDRFQSIGAFNEIADTIEYRSANDELFAIIFRYRDVTPGNGGRTVLAVEKVGRDGAPGCRVAQIGGGEADADGQAQTIADRRAASSDCANDPVIVGNAR